MQRTGFPLPATTQKPTPNSESANGKPSESNASRDIGRAVGLISGLVLVSRLLGFLRDAIIASMFGSSRITDAYFYAFKIPDTLWNLIAGGAFYAAFVPVVTEYFTHGKEERAWKMYSIVSTFLFVVLSVLIPLGWIFARPLLQYFIAPGLSDYEVVPGHGVVHPLSMAVMMTRIVLPSQYCFFLGTLMMGMLQAKKKFLMPALAPVIYNLGIIIGGVSLSRWFGIAGFSWGALGGAFVGNFLLQAWAIRGIGARFSPSLALQNRGVRKAGKLVLPVIFGVSLPQAMHIVNGMFVAKIASANTILEYTNRLMQLPLGIFGQAIGIAVLPTLSQHAAEDDMVSFRRTLNYGVRLSVFLTLPLSVLMIVLAQPLIALVYQRGTFTAEDTLRAVPALVFFAIGVASWSAQAVVARAFYARNDTWTPVLAGTFVTFIIFIPLNFVLTPLFNVPGTPLLVRGPALASSLASIVNTVMLLYFAAKRFGGINARRIIQSLLVTVAASVPMALVAWQAYGLLHRLMVQRGGHGSLAYALELGTAGLVGLAVFGGVALVLGSSEIRELKGLVRRRAPG